MRIIDRRSFLVMSAGGLTSQAALAQTSTGRTYQPAVPSTNEFLVNPGFTARYDSAAQQMSQAVPWAFFPASEAGSADLLSPQSFSIDQLEAWAAQQAANCCTPGANVTTSGTDPFDVFMKLPLTGTPAVSDIQRTALGSIADGVALDLTLDFFSPAAGNASLSQPSFSSVGGLPMVDLPDSSALLTQPGTVAQPSANPAPPHIELFGWRLQFRGPETHPLGSCVSAPVTHFNVEIFQAIGGGRYKYAANFHLGTYRDAGRRCFVLYNNVRPVVCWKTCSPSINDLAGMFRWMLAAAAAVLLVAIAAWIIAAIAEAAAALIFAPLLLLA